MCTIPHDERLEAIREALNNRGNPEIPTDEIVNFAELVLKNNSFEFDGKHYLQILGTATGKRMAPSCANLFMDRLERKLLSQAQVKALV